MVFSEIFSTTAAAALNSWLSQPWVQLVVPVLLGLVYFVKWRANKIVSAKGFLILVTGCDSGLGKLVVHAALESGFKVVAACATEEGATKFEGTSVTTVVADLTTEAGRDKVANVTLSTAGESGLYALVNSDGICLAGNIAWLPPRSYEISTDLNFHAPVALIYKLLPSIKSMRGRVINITSADGFINLPTNAAYCASKHALESYSDTLRCEMLPWGVKVVVVEPGIIRTPLAMSYSDGWLKSYREAPKDRVAMYGDAWAESVHAASKHRVKEFAADPCYTVDAILQAIKLVNPPTRIVTGKIERYFLKPVSLLPDAFRDWFLYKAIFDGPPPVGLMCGKKKPSSGKVWGGAFSRIPKEVGGQLDSIAGIEQHAIPSSFTFPAKSYAQLNAYIEELVTEGLLLTSDEGIFWREISTKGLTKCQLASIAGTEIELVRHVGEFDNIGADIIFDLYSRLMYTKAVDTSALLMKPIEDIDLKLHGAPDYVAWCHVLWTVDRFPIPFSARREFVTLDFVSKRDLLWVSRSVSHPGVPETEAPGWSSIISGDEISPKYRMPLLFYLRVVPKENGGCTVLQVQWTDPGGIIPEWACAKAITQFGFDNMARFRNLAEVVVKKKLPAGREHNGYLTNPLKPNWRYDPCDMVPGIKD